jgi:hypothetical protein
MTFKTCYTNYGFCHYIWKIHVIDCDVGVRRLSDFNWEGGNADVWGDNPPSWPEFEEQI